MERQFHSLEDFLASTMSHVDGVLDDGWGFGFPVKGREIEATVLFADISGFSTRTLDMSPAATLVYVQNFFAWVTAEALQDRHGLAQIRPSRTLAQVVDRAQSREFPPPRR